MKPSSSPFPCRWQSFDLEKAGLRDLRPRVGTYGSYDFFALPPLPFELRGDWSWLRANKPFEHNILDGATLLQPIPDSIRSLEDDAGSAGVTLPETFLRFVSDEDLPSRVRSNTLCYLDPSPGLGAPPNGNGRLVRFLSDSQGCLFWYLYLAPDGDHAVLSSGDFYGASNEEEGYFSGPYSEGVREDRKTENLSFAAESFEEFICRFWIENEIWFAGFEKREIPPDGQRYVEAYRSRR